MSILVTVWSTLMILHFEFNQQKLNWGSRSNAILYIEALQQNVGPIGYVWAILVLAIIIFLRLGYSLCLNSLPLVILAVLMYRWKTTVLYKGLWRFFIDNSFSININVSVFG